MLREEAAKLKTPQGVLRDALDMLQLSVEFSLLRMCQCFEKERKRTDEQLASREEELAFMATHDPLTGLPEPDADRRPHRADARAAPRAKRTSVAALFVDLDNFKTINDTLGHAVGDELLQAVAARLHGVVREVDALGRLGGDEFVVLVGDLAADASPELVAERLLDALKQPFKLGPGGETHRHDRASIGIATGDQATAGDLLRDADIAMYRAKWDGRNRYAMFESGMQDVVQERMELEMDLRDALAREQFFLAYQPTLDLADMRPTGVEALIRWQHPERGDRAAGQLHPAARGDRPDHRGRPLGARRELPPGRRVDGRRARHLDGRQRLRPPARQRPADRRHPRRARASRASRPRRSRSRSPRRR